MYSHVAYPFRLAVTLKLQVVKFVEHYPPTDYNCDGHIFVDIHSSNPILFVQKIAFVDCVLFFLFLKFNPSKAHLLGGNFRCFQCLGILKNFHNLLFFDQESANDTFPNTSMTQYTAIGTTNGLLAFRYSGSFTRASWSNSVQFLFALATLWYILTLLNVLIYEATTRRTNTERN